MSSTTPKKRSPAGVVALFVAGSLLYVELFIQPACNSETMAGVDAAQQPMPDSAVNIDSGSKVDAAGNVDASGNVDAAIDGAPTDAGIDSTVTPDASIDGASIDASIDAPPDA